MKKEITVIVLFCALATATLVWNKSVEGVFLSSSNEEIESDEKEAKTDQPSKYFEFHRGIRTREGSSSPNYPAGFIAKEINKANAWARKARIGSNGVVEWKERGPANVPGRTRALLNIPGDAANNTWLAGAATGGVWKTTNGGDSWTEKSADFPAMPISSFAMSSSNPNLIYAGTGEYVSTRFTAIGDGIFKSTDKGETWTQLSSTAGNENFTIVTRIITDPADANIILASTVRSFWTTNAEETSIMRSINGGTSWTEVYSTTGAVEQLVYTPGNFQIQYASLNGVGVLKSIDSGLTWNLSNTGMAPLGRLELAVSPANTNKIYASAEGSLSGTGSDLYVSSNAGVTWSLIDVKLSSLPVDFLLGQGFYDNTILCDPFNENIVYFGGVSLFRTTTGAAGTSVDSYKMKEEDTDFLFLQAFTGILWDNGRLTVGSAANARRNVEVRFGPGKTQKAHRFLVPADATSGVPASDYTYQNYVDVPFEVWDITNNQQLMISFRDQNRDGAFNLVPQQFDPAAPADPVDPLIHSREYFYIHNVTYNTTAYPNISTAGGHEHNLMYNFFPALAAGQTWDPNNLPESKLTIQYAAVQKITSATVTVADSRGQFGGKNGSNQVNLENGVHPDHHYMIPIIVDATAKTYKILLGNDGGPFISKTSTTPGIASGDWTFKGNTYITSQFYGADKKPGADEYIGGLQDNGTRISPQGESASNTTEYSHALSGDGFEVLWNSLDGDKIIGSIYNNRFYKSINGGQSWVPAFSGFSLVDDLPDETKYPFFSRLANSKYLPDRIFAIGTDGVWRSTNFGDAWTLTPITTQWGTNTFFMDVEVSASNANIVWAGAAISSNARLHVSVDGGTSFTATNNYSENMGVISKLGSHPLEDSTAYALFSFANAPKVLRTTDLGQTWEDISGFGTNDESSTGFPDVAVFCIYVRPDNPDIIWVGTEIGIVESQDNGVSWALIDDFPNVSVWDMKGQDDQVVIATHGRGIWTAIVEAPQVAVKTPQITNSGTSPKEELFLNIKIEENFDSVRLYENATLLKTFHSVTPSELLLKIAGLSPGSKKFKMISYKGTAPYHSAVYPVQYLDILSIQNSYSTYFTAITDLTLTGFSVKTTSDPLTSARRTLQTAHNYPNNENQTITLRHPIKVSDTFPMLFYSDIALVEPGDLGSVFGTPEFKDYVVMEATKNGLDWTPLAPGYNARYNQDWLNAFNAHEDGDGTMLISHELDLSETFNAGDTLLIRYRLSANKTVSGWGAAVNFIIIQQTPTGVENPIKSKPKLSLYPNPSDGNFTLEYELTRQSEVRVEISDVFGKRLFVKDLGKKEAGPQKEPFTIPNLQGNYLLLVKTNTGTVTTKISIKR